eukprot:15480277-Alexandrium_andersonii.AAC.1
MAQGAKSANHNSLTARQCCNPPQSAIRPAEHANLLRAIGAGMARTQERPQHWSPKLPSGAFHAV